MPATLTVTAVTGMPEVAAGDDLADLVVRALAATGLQVDDGDVLVVSSKVVSKSLGLVAADPDREAVVRSQTRRVVAERLTAAGGVTQVVESLAGPVMAAAGVDGSNTGPTGRLLMLPADPDAVSRQLRSAWLAAFRVRRLGVLLSDTAGRPWRAGQTDLAIGAAGLRVVDDLAGTQDADGRPLLVTARALADEIAAAADLVKGKATSVPVAHVRGLDEWVPDADDLRADDEQDGARSLVRTGRDDWFGYGAAEAVRAALGVPPGSPLAHRVGLPATGEELRDVRGARAVAVALAGVDGAPVGVDVGARRLVVTGEDPVERGILAARLVVALAGEGIAAHIDRGGATQDAVPVVVDPDPAG